MKMLITLAALATAAVSGQGGARVPATDRAPTTDLTRQQALERADGLFQRFDVNHDGVVTREEAELVGRQLLIQRAATGTDAAPGLGGHTLRYLERAFAGLQSVNRQQFEQAMLAHFDEMDVNHDGVLTVDERRQARAIRPPQSVHAALGFHEHS
jgi:Ca2+-binding EF-hand superfamily protein